MKPLKNCLNLGCRCSYSYHLFSMSTICTQLSPLFFHCHQWINSGHFRFLIKKKLHSSRVVKRCTRFWTKDRILIEHLSFMHHIFTLCFNQLQYLHFVCHQVMLWMLSSSSLHVTFFTSICAITYVSRGFRTDDSWMICFQLTLTLYHCATEDYGNVLLFAYLYLNLPWFF